MHVYIHILRPSKSHKVTRWHCLRYKYWCHSAIIPFFILPHTPWKCLHDCLCSQSQKLQNIAYDWLLNLHDCSNLFHRFWRVVWVVLLHYFASLYCLLLLLFSWVSYELFCCFAWHVVAFYVTCSLLPLSWLSDPPISTFHHWTTEPVNPLILLTRIQYTVITSILYLAVTFPLAPTKTVVNFWSN